MARSRDEDEKREDRTGEQLASEMAHVKRAIDNRIGPLMRRVQDDQIVINMRIRPWERLKKELDAWRRSIDEAIDKSARPLGEEAPDTAAAAKTKTAAKPRKKKP
jgi:hypothetical protein